MLNGTRHKAVKIKAEVPSYAETLHHGQSIEERKHVHVLGKKPCYEASYTTNCRERGEGQKMSTERTHMEGRRWRESSFPKQKKKKNKGRDRRERILSCLVFSSVLPFSTEGETRSRQ